MALFLKIIYNGTLYLKIHNNHFIIFFAELKELLRYMHIDKKIQRPIENPSDLTRSNIFNCNDIQLNTYFMDAYSYQMLPTMV